MPDQYVKVEDLEKIVRGLNARIRSLEVQEHRHPTTWHSFNPTVNQGATPLTISNIVCRYGKLATLGWLDVSFQITSAGAVGGGVFEVTIPAAAAVELNGILVIGTGEFIYTQAATGFEWQGSVIAFSSTVLRFYPINQGAGAGYFATAPFAFQAASGDRLGIRMHGYPLLTP